ncbi:NTP transferase domain-containing protein [Streptomyces sp. NPDC059740]|uniref:NTP transferase domain-containing protein n=1 Tax=Streptomyces sp. NPDC059740 TaxID=3346926 RepID=UPI003654E9B9
MASDQYVSPDDRRQPGRCPPYDAVVLAGGAARRLSGVDKPSQSVGGRTLLDRTLSACADAGVTVVVGPRRPSPRPVVRTLEDPPGSGPLAALHAGLRHVDAEWVLVVAADHPFLTPETVEALLRAATDEAGPSAEPRAAVGLGTGHAVGAADGPGAGQAVGAAHGLPVAGGAGASGVSEGALLRDAGGRDQPLLAVYRAEALRRELALLHAEHASLAGLPFRLLLAGLRVHRVADPTGEASFDCDTWEDLRAARTRIREHGNVLDEWITAAKAELGIDLDVDTRALLDLARDAAHGVARPAAPLTTFLVGYAAAQQGKDVPELAAGVAELARRWAAEADGDGN